MKRSPPTDQKEKPPDVRQHTGRPVDKQKRNVSITQNCPTKVGSLSFLSLAHETQNDNATGLLSDFVGNDAKELPCCINDTPHDSPCQKHVADLASLDAAIERERELMQAADDQGDDLEFVGHYEKLLKFYEQFFAQRMVTENGP